MPDIEPMCTLTEAADLLRLDQQTVRKLIRDGKITAYAPARKILIPQSELSRLLADSRLSGGAL